MKNIKTNKVKTVVKNWRVGDCLRQTSIVVIGILITFTGSDLISRCSDKRDIQATMLLIEDELKANREKYVNLLSEFDKDERLSALLVKHDMNYREIPLDSLKQYLYVVGRTRKFDYSRNALEILSNSMQMQNISDKEFLLSLNDVYETLERCKVSVNGYYDMKEKVTVPFHLSLSDKQTKLLYEGGYDAWEIYLSDVSIRNFLRIAQRYFSPGHKDGIIQKIDKVLLSLEEKYGDD